MLTVTQLARRYDISRTVILYYEREGLFMPHFRSANGYRWYGIDEFKRLEAIMAYRAFGIPVSSIAPHFLTVKTIGNKSAFCMTS
ncbi:MerR family transcriptional regulator [Endozoicomonas sp.]|uniref:MerR family transcriptional regulator n=1 Tax=Endozoicomonas sp. TaxID=1892382 RepID=UPI0028856008|nr:MerR family DNA-binding transcriptional regulator [Endozoicomonas sp.]